MMTNSDGRNVEMGGEPGRHGAQQPPVSFDQWREQRSGDLPLDRVELIRALVHGRLIIESAEGSKVYMDNFHVDDVGLCKTDVEVDIVERRVLTEDVRYPDGPVRGMFFRDDEAKVGEPFQMVTYDPRTRQRVLANLLEVTKLTIQPRTNGNCSANGLAED